MTERTLREQIEALQRYGAGGPGNMYDPEPCEFGDYLSRAEVLAILDAHTAAQPAPDAVAEADDWNTIGAGAVGHMREMYRPAYDALGSSGRTSLRNWINTPFKKGYDMSELTKNCTVRDGLFVEPCDTLAANTDNFMPGFSKAKGIFRQELTNRNTLKPARTYYGIKTKAHPNGFLFNNCPFCGEDISAPFMVAAE